jgi:4-diphosphocytidyl-2C-methyl-D-erythritol kinase
MKSLYDVSAPAKLNLFLHIVGRREDGYHLLESVFRLIDWCDTLHFETRTDGQISREDLETSCRGVAKLVKALDFDSSMQRFESFSPAKYNAVSASRSRRSYRTQSA